MKEMYFHLAETTYKETVENFFKKFHNKVDLFDKVLVMDNHAAHASLEVQNFLESKGIKVLFLPPCSSYFNPIETIWSWVKGKWRNSLLQVQNLNSKLEGWMIEELTRICKSCPT